MGKGWTTAAAALAERGCLPGLVSKYVLALPITSTLYFLLYCTDGLTRSHTVTEYVGANVAATSPLGAHGHHPSHASISFPSLGGVSPQRPRPPVGLPGRHHPRIRPGSLPGIPAVHHPRALPAGLPGGGPGGRGGLRGQHHHLPHLRLVGRPAQGGRARLDL